MNFYFQPRTQAYKSWEQIKIGDRVMFSCVPYVPATVRKILYCDGPYVAIEFDKPVPYATHNCCGDVPSGNGYFISTRALIEKIIE